MKKEFEIIKKEKICNDGSIDKYYLLTKKVFGIKYTNYSFSSFIEGDNCFLSYLILSYYLLL